MAVMPARFKQKRTVRGGAYLEPRDYDHPVLAAFKAWEKPVLEFWRAMKLWEVEVPPDIGSVIVRYNVPLSDKPTEKTPALVERMKTLGVIPNPFSTYVYYHGEKMKEYGAERLQRMFAVRSFLDAGLKVTQTSDYPPGTFQPMMALQSMVHRTDRKGTLWGPKQKVTVEEALRVGTMQGAYASFEEELKGSYRAK